MDMVVTDHHRPAETLPACPVVHPSVCGYPAELCATGVAYKFAQALYRAAGRDPAELEPQLDLVALATVADLVPLVGENRTLVKQGLRAIAGTSRPGLRALMRVTAVDPQSVTEQTLGFALAPRINAAGRLYRADAALELMLTTDEDRALEIARELDAVNTERQSVETAILFEAERLLSDRESPDPAAPPTRSTCSPTTTGIPASSASSPRASWSATTARSCWSRCPSRARAAGRAAASRPTTCTPALPPAPRTSSGSAATAWRRGSRSRPSASTTSVPRWSPTPAAA